MELSTFLTINEAGVLVMPQYRHVNSGVSWHDIANGEGGPKYHAYDCDVIGLRPEHFNPDFIKFNRGKLKFNE